MGDIKIGDKYYITKEDQKESLGKGAFGEVFRCHNKRHTNKVYAAKRLHFVEGNPAIEYIKSEIEILEAVKNLMKAKKLENAIKLHKYYHNPDVKEKCQHFDLIFEYCGGGDLKSLIEKNGIFSEQEIYYILYPIVVCLASLHKKLIIHRDIKPANILFVEPWNPRNPEKTEVRLTDFGVSIMGEKLFVSKVGTRLEMAPEVINEKECDSAIDVYSFGLTLYQMLFNENAFNAETYNAWFNGERAYLKMPKCRFVTVECFDLLQRCLRFEPSKRISFEKMKEHPFFKNKGVGRIFYEMFDGTQDVNFISMKGDCVDYIKMFDEEINSDIKDPICASNDQVINSIIERNQT